MMRITAAFLLLAAAVAACDDGTGPEDTGRVEVRFEAATGAAASASPAAAATAVPVVGSNGTLEIESVHMIVGELELEAAEHACSDDDGEGRDDDCEEFEVDPFLLELPLEGPAVVVATADVRPGTYTAFEFEVEDIDDDEDDDEGELAAVLAEARALHPDWPSRGSVVVEGTFTPSGDVEPRPFRTFIEAEIEIESRFAEPLVVEADGNAAVTVVLDPEVWFSRPDGTVLDLSLWDFTGGADDLLELEVELEEGVVEVEVESG